MISVVSASGGLQLAKKQKLAREIIHTNSLIRQTKDLARAEATNLVGNRTEIPSTLGALWRARAGANGWCVMGSDGCGK